MADGCDHDWQAQYRGSGDWSDGQVDIRCWQWQCTRCSETAPVAPPDMAVRALQAQLAAAQAECDRRIEPRADRSVMVALSKVLYRGDHGHPRFDSSWLLTELENSLDCCEDDCDTRASAKYCDKHLKEMLDVVARLARQDALREAAEACERCADGVRAQPLPRTGNDVARYRLAEALATMIRDLAHKAPPPFDLESDGPSIRRIPRDEATRTNVYPSEQPPCRRCNGTREVRFLSHSDSGGAVFRVAPCPLCGELAHAQS